MSKVVTKRKIIPLVIALLLIIAAIYIIISISMPDPVKVTISKDFIVFGLLTNGVSNPLAIDNENPLFSWEIESNKRDFEQTAYQIVVSQGKKTIWNSGKIKSSDSSNVEYKGRKKLKANTEYQWKVRVWDKDGYTSVYSLPAPFNVGLSKKDWNAKYIWGSKENQNNYNYFRKSFKIDKQIKRAIVYTTAHNDYQLYLNGEFVGVGPARSNPYTYGPILCI